MKEFFTVLILTVVFVYGVVYASFWITGKQCLAKYSSYKVEYGFLEGCRIEWNGKMTPTTIIREMNQ